MKEWVAKVGSAYPESALRQAHGWRCGLEINVIGELADLLATDDRRHDLRWLPGFRNVAVVMNEMTHRIAVERYRRKVAVAPADKIAFFSSAPA
jgi:hypothetical protein